MAAVENAATSARNDLFRVSVQSARTDSEQREEDRDTAHSRTSRHGLGAAVVQDVDEIRRRRRQDDEQLHTQTQTQGPASTSTPSLPQSGAK